MSHHRFGVLAPLVALCVLATTLPGEALAPDTIDGSAAVSAVAVPLAPTLDAVSVSQTGELTPAVRDAALAAARDAGAPAVVTRGFTAGMTRVRRGVVVVQQSTGAGWAFPMAVSALPLDAIGAVMGRSVAAPIAEGKIVMGQTTASLRGAIAGDTVDLLASNGGTVTFTIGRVASDAEVGGTEIVMGIPQADMLGAVFPTRVLIYGPSNRTVMTNALHARGLYSNTKVRVRQTWDPPDPDGTLSTVRTKALLGEFDIDMAHLTTNGWTSLNANWRATYLPAARQTYPTGVKAMCNVVIRADLTAALQEVVNTVPGLVNWDDAGVNEGLASTTGIDVENANTYGGCATGQARFSRITQNLGSVSRHSWGQPIDMSTVANCQGCVPRMDCRIVRIFRKHHFAWGGNFLTTDGMHFEWVGEARNLLQYPSKYCRNTVNGQIQSTGPPPEVGLATLFADDGWMGE